MIRKLQSAGEEAIGRLEKSKEKRAEVVAWCGTGLGILSEYLNQNEKAKLLTQALTSNVV